MTFKRSGRPTLLVILISSVETENQLSYCGSTIVFSQTFRTLASSVTDFSTLNLALSRSFSSTGRAVFQGTIFQHKFQLEPGVKNDQKFRSRL